jgi:2,5-diamino-6-(ribosylamino)-4(3H)-pyrimidinone 5'-phosphate reductase
MLRVAVEGKGKAPWVVISPGAQIHPQKLMMLKGYGGDYLRIVEYNQSWRLRWEAILRALAAEGIQSLMIEGGGTILSELLNPEYSDFIDSIIVTVAPTWTPLGQNVIMCGKIRVPVSSEPPNLSGDEGSARDPL